jgi:hypothetical protein
MNQKKHRNRRKRQKISYDINDYRKLGEINPAPGSPISPLKSNVYSIITPQQSDLSYNEKSAPFPTTAVGLNMARESIPSGQGHRGSIGDMGFNGPTIDQLEIGYTQEERRKLAPRIGKVKVREK